MQIIKTVAIVFIVLIVFFAVFITYHFYSDVPVTTSEVFRDDEAAQTQRAAENFVNVIKETTTTYAARGAHAKGHACVKAYFEVSDSIDADLRHGVFQTPGKVYKSWIRFSNGSSNLAKSDDAKKDSRGMALKLININEAGLGLAEGGTNTQEFLMHNNPVFFSANVEDYNQLVESENKILSFFSGKNPFKWRLRELGHVFDTLAPPPYSPLWDNYFSNTAYKLGPHNIKFSAQSCSPSPDTASQDQSAPDFLRETMAGELMKAEACFNFMVQIQDADKYMPIEDPSIEWRESESPYITIATIKIPAQSFDTDEQQQFCEDLSFSPWHTLAAHRPIGQLNRIRKQVYEASSRYRHETNKTQVPVSLDW
jgi:catalase